MKKQLLKKSPVRNKEKYSFKPYRASFVKQFDSERKILQKIFHKKLKIEHFGSTAVPKLGGKGIIDVIIQVPKEDMLKSKKILEDNGYEFKPALKKRLFFKKYYKKRKVHVHLVYLGTNEFTKEIAVREYLRNNQREAEKYAKVKKKAVKHAEGIGIKYRDYKKPYLDKLEKKALKFYKSKTEGIK